MNEYITCISKNDYFIFELDNFPYFGDLLFKLFIPFSESMEEFVISELPFIMSRERKDVVVSNLLPYVNKSNYFMRLKHFFIDILENECFYLMFDICTQEFCLDAQKSLEYYNQKYDHDWVAFMMEDYMKDKAYLMKLHKEAEAFFDINFFSYVKKEYLGEKDKKARTCRFCKRDKSLGVTFKKDAHAIPAFLGNTTLFQNEECDECNGYFGKTLEVEFEKYTKLFRVFSGIKGRNGIPEIRNDKIDFFYTELDDGTGVPVVLSRLGQSTDEVCIEINSGETFSPIDVYKMFCKIFFSVVDQKILKQFDDTLKWVRYDTFTFNKLPMVAFYFFHNKKFDRPQVTTYIDKQSVDRSTFAFMELDFGQFVFIVQIPSKENEIKLHYTADEYGDFLSGLSHYKDANFDFYDFSGHEQAGFKMNLFINGFSIK